VEDGKWLQVGAGWDVALATVWCWIGRKNDAGQVVVQS